MVLALASYLLGGIPSGYLIARYAKGIDIRQHGSGNPGAANVYRTVGRGAGILTLTLDALKGYLPVLLAVRLYPDNHLVTVLCGAMAIVGHIWTIFLRFKGGKGVATSAGVFLALLPKPILASMAAFGAGVALSGHISVGSMAGSLTMPFFCILFGSPLPLTYAASAASLLILLKHIPNLRRLMGNKELSYK